MVHFTTVDINGCPSKMRGGGGFISRVPPRYVWSKWSWELQHLDPLCGEAQGDPILQLLECWSRLGASTHLSQSPGVADL